MLRKQMECKTSSPHKLSVYTQTLNFEVFTTQLANEHHFAIKRLVQTDNKSRFKASVLLLMHNQTSFK